VVRPARRLAESGVVFEWVQDRADVRSGIEEVFELHSKRFTVKQADSLFKADLRQPFHQDLGGRFFYRGALRLLRVRDKGRTIAAMYCFEFDDSLFYFKGGFDPEWEEHSVGMVIMPHAIQYALDRELKLFDFMRGSEPYNYHWTSSERRLVVVRIGSSLRGRAALAAARQFTGFKTAVKRLLRRARSAPAVPVAHQA
jgi:CelD/BcsL family acetyltransferase involved in cellulose biosynthesis